MTARPARRTAAQEARRIRQTPPADLWGMVGRRSGELLTSDGYVIVHDNPAELVMLITGADPIALPPSAIREGRTVPVAALEDCASLMWPLEATDFREDGDGYYLPAPAGSNDYDHRGFRL